MNRALERPVDFQSDSTRRRYKSAARKVVRSLLFVDEPELTGPVCGTATFSRDFMTRGPFDSQKRSLRQLNLEQRLFEWPCSFLIYSDAFQALPSGVHRRVEAELYRILSGHDQTETYAHLSPDQRADIRAILKATTKLRLDHHPQTGEIQQEIPAAGAGRSSSR
ncbi:MAG: hypothetical protein GY758_03220 [Fuerstiella sp.]|nr:hypothetical protein [Fuerstiella sp.]